jgi:phosphopantothenoylcysteine decarboxylase/phosphopantothenate--cysteine ligase
VKEGALVRVVMTRSAADFVTPKTLSVLSRNEVYTDFFSEDHRWHNHVELGEWCDLFLIAPATANTLAKMNTGICDNLLLACFLSCRSKVCAAPAMDLEMYKHATVRSNLEALDKKGVQIIPAETGELASGLSGEGRMAEPEKIVQILREFFSAKLPLSGKKALVNAGPTYEAIDPVRFIGNRSSGKMGVAIAEELARQGAEVVLVLGPSSEKVQDGSINVIRVESGREMYEASLQNYEGKDVVICTAAVADYRPKNKAVQKIKKTSDDMSLELVKTDDILAELGRKKQKQLLVGFALETENLEAYAQEKLLKKNLDLIVANSASEPGSGFSGDTNRLILIDKHNKITKFELQSKQAAASQLVKHLLGYLR